MRRVGGLVAVLLILGLAAAAFVSRQKDTPGSSPAAVADLPAASTSQTAAAASPRTPVNRVRESFRAGADGATTHSAEPTRLADATRDAPAVPNTPAPNVSAQSKPTVSAIPACDKPGGMGVARIVEIDTTGGPGFGFEHFKQYDFLRDKEVVFTFDDGPWPGSTPAVSTR
jgi:hypothetical protein